LFETDVSASSARSGRDKTEKSSDCFGTALACCKCADSRYMFGGNSNSNADTIAKKSDCAKNCEAIRANNPIATTVEKAAAFQSSVAVF
jgi:hypothetical protein